MSKIPFRVSDGLDGADIRAINIGYPDITNPTDGVNVQFFVDENTLQHYDANRKYKKGFSVIYNNRVYYARRDVPTDDSSSAGAFNEVNWQQLRTDPNWNNVSTSPPTGLLIEVGAYISADPTYSDIDLILPRAPKSGDTVVIKDVSGKLSTKRLKVISQDKSLDTGKLEYQMTYPKSTLILSYDPAGDAGRGSWRMTTFNPSLSDTVAIPSAQGTQLSAGDTVFRRSANGKIKFILPRYANDGDSITTYDLDQMTSVNNLTIETHPDATSSIGSAGVKSMTFKTVGWGRLIYTESTKLWTPWDGDEYEKWMTIRPTTPASDIKLLASSRVIVAGSEGEINFTLPSSPAIGETVTVSLRNAAAGVKINFKAATNEKIYATPEMFGISRLNEVPKFEDIVPVSEINYIATGYGDQFKFVYVNDFLSPGWAIAEQAFVSFKASQVASVRHLPGLVAFATEAEILLNSEDNPTDEKAVTPLTLAKKTATETRRGIAFIATQNETNAGVNDLEIVTPKKLHERTALEDRRGIAEIATQDETNAGTDDQRIVTPKKLAGRVSKEDQTGVIALVKVGGTKQADRTTPGTNINDFNEHTKAVTPKTLAEKTATETNLGMGFWATQTEVNNGSAGNIFVRPSTLQERTATATRTGLARMVDMTQDEHKKSVADSLHTNVFITPKALADRTATADMDGITRSAKDEDIVAGTNEFKFVSPAKLKYFTDVVAKQTAPDADGLNITGTIWKGLTYTIDLSTEIKRGTLRVATQKETDDGLSDALIVTPKKLNDRNATVSKTGIMRLATAAEAAQGVLDNVAITPYTMGSAINNSSEWGSTELRRGAAYIAGLTNDNTSNTVWQGNDVDGSTRVLGAYKHDFYAVSPRGLNTALSHYLPKGAKAVDSDKLDGLDNTQFMRTDKDTETTGTLTVSKNIFTSWLTVNSTPTVSAPGVYLGWNKDTQNNHTDLYSVKGTGKGGFAFWVGSSDIDLTRVVLFSETGRISAEGINTTSSSTIGGYLTVNGEINYRGQTLDARFINAAGDKMTGNLSFDPGFYVNVLNNKQVNGTLNTLIRGEMATNDFGYIAVGATSSDNGFLEIGTGNTGTEPVYIRQRQGATIRNSFTALDEVGNTYAPKTISANKLVIRSQDEGMIAWGNKQAKVNNVGDIFGEVWDNKYLSQYLKGIVDAKVSKSGDSMEGDLLLKKDLIIEGSLKIKVGNKYLVIRPNAVNETVSFDWETV